MPRQGVQYVGEEPSFISKLKERVGFKEGPDVNTKRRIPNFDEDDDDDDIIEKEDEKPTVVVLKSGDLTAEEADSAQKEIDDGPARLHEKITFKKPVKRKPDEVGKDDSDLSKDSAEEPKKKIKEGKSKDSKKGKQQTSLLSFGDEDEEEEET